MFLNFLSQKVTNFCSKKTNLKKKKKTNAKKRITCDVVSTDTSFYSIFLIFSKLFNPGFHFLLFLESTVCGTCSGQMVFFEKRNLFYLVVALKNRLNIKQISWKTKCLQCDNALKNITNISVNCFNSRENPLERIH